MNRFGLSSLMLLAVICARPAVAQSLDSQARLVVPAAASGWAQIPLVNAHPQDRFVNDPPASCRAQFDDSALVVEFRAAITPGLRPAAPTQRDANEIWAESTLSAEIFLQPAGAPAYTHYIVNSGGGVYDERNDDRSFNGHALVASRIDGATWRVQVKIPFSDLHDGGRPDLMRANFIVQVRDPNKTYAHTWAAVGAGYKNPSAFGVIELAADKVFAGEALLGPIEYTAHGAQVLAQYLLKNPAPTAAVIESAATRLTLPPGGERRLELKMPLPARKNAVATFDVKNVLHYQHRVINELVPDVSIVADDFRRFRIALANREFLNRYAAAVQLYLDARPVKKVSLPEVDTVCFDLGNAPPGEHSVRLAFLSAAGEPAFDYTHTFTTYDIPHYDDPRPALDVSKYYPPLQLQDHQLRAARSRFDLSRGALPRQVRVDSREILASPIRIEFDGHPVDIPDGYRVLQQDRNTCRLSGDAAGMSIDAQYDYDGFAWFDVTLKGKRKYGPLEVIIPLKLAKDIILTRTGPYFDNQFTRGDPIEGSYEQKYMGRCELLTRTLTELPFTTVVSLATDESEQYRGLAFVTEGPAGWNLKNYDRMYRIERVGTDRVNLIVRISDGQTPWEVDRIRFSFGIEPFPMRTYPRHIRRTWRLDNTFDDKDYVHRLAEEKRTGQQNFFDRLRGYGARIEVAHEYWTEYENYWKTDLRDADMKAYVKDAHDHAIQVLVYFGFLFSNQVPEFAYYNDLFLKKPSDYFGNIGAMGPGGMDFYSFYHFGSPDQRAYNVCYNSAWGDWLMHGAESAFDRYGFDGAYLDGMVGPAACANPKHGCGVTDFYGRRVMTSPVRAHRRMMEILFSNGHKRSKNFMIDLHMSEPCAPYIGLVDGMYIGETSHLFDPEFARIEPGGLRGWMNGHLYGVPVDMLLRPPYYQNLGWAQALLVDARIRMAAGGGDLWVALCQRLWRLDEHYGLEPQTFTPYFSDRSKVKSDNDKVLISYYDTPKALLLVLSAYWQKEDQPVTIDLSRFAGLDTRTAVDLWKGDQPLPIKESKLTTTVPGLSLRLVQITKQ